MSFSLSWWLSVLFYREKLHFREGLRNFFFFCNHTVGSAQPLDNSVLFLKRDILTLTGGRRWGTFVTLLLSRVIFSCRGSQMVRFSAHMVLFPLRLPFLAYLAKRKNNNNKSEEMLRNDKNWIRAGQHHLILQSNRKVELDKKTTTQKGVTL